MLLIASLRVVKRFGVFEPYAAQTMLRTLSLKHGHALRCPVHRIQRRTPFGPH